MGGKNGGQRNERATNSSVAQHEQRLALLVKIRTDCRQGTSTSSAGIVTLVLRQGNNARRVVASCTDSNSDEN